MAQKRTILITGCSDGSLGSALALAFHKTGWRVFASARNPSKLKEAESAGIETIQLDVLSENSIADGVAKVKELTGGSLDALFNNAGAGYSLPLMDIDIGKAQELFDLNVFSIIRMTRAFLPLLIESNGMVVNHTSAASVPAGALPFQGAYNASKAAAASLTEAMRLELAPFGVKVINLITGFVQSTFFDNAPTAILPPTSLYNIAKEAIEKAMGYDATTKKVSDRIQWANQVAKDVSRSHPPHWVWRGQYTLQVRLASLFPIGFFDGPKKKLSGLDVLERKIKEQGGARRSRHHDAILSAE
ncbi:putative estradiol 17 beta-dehydrogenase [Daldinia loculata]|nr:putative estradiol 17 beta-dehydrogenase [Daldinia loculata]